MLPIGSLCPCSLLPFHLSNPSTGGLWLSVQGRPVRAPGKKGFTAKQQKKVNILPLIELFTSCFGCILYFWNGLFHKSLYSFYPSGNWKILGQNLSWTCVSLNFQNEPKKEEWEEAGEGRRRRREGGREGGGRGRVRRKEEKEKKEVREGGRKEEKREKIWRHFLHFILTCLHHMLLTISPEATVGKMTQPQMFRTSGLQPENFHSIHGG